MPIDETLRLKITHRLQVKACPRMEYDRPAWLQWLVWPGPRAMRRDRGRAHLLGLCGRTRSLRLRQLHGCRGGPRDGGPEGEVGSGERRRAPWRPTIKLVAQSMHRFEGRGRVRVPSTPTYKRTLPWTYTVPKVVLLFIVVRLTTIASASSLVDRSAHNYNLDQNPKEYCSRVLFVI